MRAKGEDVDRWIKGMRRLQAQFGESALRVDPS